jgi:hypothetical protein
MVVKHVAPAYCRSRNNLLGGVCVSGVVRGTTGCREATGLVLIRTTCCPTATGRVKMAFSGVFSDCAIRHLPQNIAYAHRILSMSLVVACGRYQQRASSPLVPRIASIALHRASHEHLPPRSSRVLWSVLEPQFMYTFPWLRFSKLKHRQQ